MRQKMARRIRLMAEYGSTVLWGLDATDIGVIDPEHLPLSTELKADLRAWAELYDKTLSQEYPPDSGFASAEEEDAFEVEGKRLWRTLQEQLGTGYKVIYKSVRDNREYE
jgi:hypothetical protein